VDLAAYREFFPNADDPCDPYYFCFYAVITKFAEINFLEIPKDNLEFTFDVGSEGEINAGQLYSYMLRLPEWRGYELLADTVHYTSRRNPRIRVADLIARDIDCKESRAKGAQ
jgi:hypothetical protein